jgi:membrane fusion protein, multidrug efflux system
LNIIKYITLLLFCGILACKEKKEAPTTAAKAPPKNIAYDGVIVTSSPASRSIETPGTILPNEIADLHPEIAGRVTNIYFKEGGFVSRGALLVKLFDGDLQAQLRKLAVQLKIAELTSKRQKELLAVSGTSQQDVDNAYLQISNIKADMELLKVNISKTQIRAPFSGRIGLRQISQGAYITPATTITNIASTNVIKLQFPVPEQYVQDVPIGSTVAFTTTANANKYFATIMATENEITSDTRNLLIKAIVKNADAQIKAGGFANVTINVGKNSAALMVPTQSIIPQTRGKRVIVVRNGIALFQNVETGYRDSAQVEILTGLMTGDTVLTSGLLVVKNNQKMGTIKINK